MQSLTGTETDWQAAISAEGLSAWKAFLRAHTVVTRALERELLESHGLPLAEYDVLVQLSEAEDGRLRMAQLADQVLLSRSGLTRLVERLETSGLVKRQVCPSDARGSFAAITPKGQARLRAAAPAHLRSVQAHFVESMSKAQLETLRQALERLADSSVSVSGTDCGSQASAAIPLGELQ